MKLNLHDTLKIIETKARKHKVITETLAALFVLIMGFLDFITGYKLSFSIFYLLPICSATWFLTRQIGYLFAFYGTAIWILSDICARDFQFDGFILAWNAITRLGFFLLFVIALSELRSGYEREKKLSRTDRLTGISNNQHFFEILNLEIQKCRRFKRPLSISYIDCDNFKQVNDNFGHQTGNDLLKVVANTLKNELRVIDVVARLGGDEFIILLLEADSSAVYETLSRLKTKLLAKMKENSWPVTFSIGTAYYNTPPESPESGIQKADELMYKAKKKGKNTIIQKIIDR